jgi:hypothetical protein
MTAVPETTRPEYGCGSDPPAGYDDPYHSDSRAAISISKLPLPADSKPTFR